MRVVQVVASIGEEASGPSYSVPALAASLLPHCVSVKTHALAPAPTFGPQIDLRAHPCWSRMARLGVSPGMARALNDAAPVSDIMHTHSLWTMPNVYPAWACRGSGCRFVISPRGTLSAWALRRSWLRKRIMWSLCLGRAVRTADCWLATAESELHEIRGVGIRSPVAVIPNGIDIPPLGPPEPRRQLRRLLFLGRIHPKKGVDVLLMAWREVQSRFSDWELHISGPDNGGYLREMRELAADLGLVRTTFTGPQYGAAKAEAYRQADLFVLPTHSENFGMTVAEALAHGVPAIVTQGAPWAGLEKHDCGWWIENSVTALASCLREALQTTPDELQAKGVRGRDWMGRDYSWEQIGKMMFDTYVWLHGGGAPPTWLFLN